MIFNRKSREDRELDASIQESQDAEGAKGRLYQRSERLHSQLSAKNRELGRAAYAAEVTGNRAPLETLEGQIAALEREITNVNAALRAADEKIGEATSHVAAARARAKDRAARRILTSRKRAIVDLQGALATIAYAYPEILQANDELRTLYNVAVFPEGTLTNDREFNIAYGEELKRLAQPDPLAPLYIPGMDRNALTNPAELRPLLERLEHADNFILKMALPDAAPVKPYGHGAQAERDPATMTHGELLEGLGRVLEPADDPLPLNTAPTDPDETLLGPPIEPAIDQNAYVNPNPVELATPEAPRQFTIVRGAIQEGGDNA